MTKGNPSTALITGAGGFLASYLANWAFERGYRLIGIDKHRPRISEIWTRFYTGAVETLDLDSILRDHDVSTVFHLAGGSSVPESLKDPLGDFNALLPPTTMLARSIGNLKQPCQLVFFSSAAVYGNPCQLPVVETQELRPISPYGAHKAIAEELILHYSRIFNVPTKILRIFSAYGVGLKRQLVWDVCERGNQARHSGRHLVKLFGTGDESRDFIHASDVAKAAVAVAEAGPKCTETIINVASGVETLVSEIARQILSNIDPEIELQFSGQSRKGDPIRWCADISRLNSLGFRPEKELPKGLADTVAWHASLRQFGS